MAEVYRKVKGKPIQEYVARMDGVQKALERHTREAYFKARNQLDAIQAREPNRKHYADLELDRGRIDRYLILVDRDPNWPNAWAIEFGRPETDENAGTEGHYIISRAMGWKRD